MKIKLMQGKWGKGVQCEIWRMGMGENLGLQSLQDVYSLPFILNTSHQSSKNRYRITFLFGILFNFFQNIACNLFVSLKQTKPSLTHKHKRTDLLKGIL